MELNLQSEVTDEARAKFLHALDDSDLVVSDWEAKFINGFLSAYREWAWWTPGRRKSADAMWMKYGVELKTPFPAERPAAQTEKIADANAGACMYLVFNQPCNAPATQKRSNGFRYCDEHAEQVLRLCKRKNKVISLQRI